ncbi:unnamed protein product, partial [Staurois parvus]
MILYCPGGPMSCQSAPVYTVYIITCTCCMYIQGGGAGTVYHH